MKFPVALALTALAALSCGAIGREDDAFLNMLEYRSCHYFLREANTANGLVPDRAAVATNDLRSRNVCSIAGGGFGLAALCIADSRGWITRTEAVARVRASLRFVTSEDAPEKNGFLFHFVSKQSGRRVRACEVSPIDTSLYLCGALTARQYFNDPEITALATKFYDRIDWPWMLNNGDTLCMGWKPETGFSRHRWHGYAEHMTMYLLAIGSRKHPISPECWHAWRREPVGRYDDHTFITCPPLFVHQYAHAFVDFRGLSDDYCDYWQNSVFATLANRRLCINLRDRFPSLGADLWGITASLSPRGYLAWGGPPETPDLDGTIVPCAAGGSIPFAPRECIHTLRTMYEKFGERVWCRYGFVDAFNPQTGWTADEVLAIDAGITLVMIENFRTGLVWDRFMANPEITAAMQSAGFRPAPKLAANTSLLDSRLARPPAHRPIARDIIAARLPLPEYKWDWHVMDASNSRESVFDGEGKISARFAFAWDEQALHIRMAVADPEVVRGDKVELYIDPENDGFRWGDYRDFLFNLSPTNHCDESLGRPLAEVTVLVTNNGYRIIAAIPWKKLGIEPRTGATIGCSPGIYSLSSHDEPALKLNWHWREEDSAIHLANLILAEPQP